MCKIMNEMEEMVKTKFKSGGLVCEVLFMKMQEFHSNESKEKNQRLIIRTL